MFVKLGSVIGSDGEDELFIRQQEKDKFFRQSLCVLSFRQFFHQQEPGSSIGSREYGAFVSRASDGINFPVTKTFSLIDNIGTQVNEYFVGNNDFLSARRSFSVFEPVSKVFIKCAVVLFVFPDKLTDALMAYHRHAVPPGFADDLLRRSLFFGRFFDHFPADTFRKPALETVTFLSFVGVFLG
jgi:hypothetical protein